MFDFLSASLVWCQACPWKDCAGEGCPALCSQPFFQGKSLSKLKETQRELSSLPVRRRLAVCRHTAPGHRKVKSGASDAHVVCVGEAGFSTSVWRPLTGPARGGRTGAQAPQTPELWPRVPGGAQAPGASTRGANMGGRSPTRLLVGTNLWPSSRGNQVHVSERTVWFGTLRVSVVTGTLHSFNVRRKVSLSRLWGKQDLEAGTGRILLAKGMQASERLLASARLAALHTWLVLAQQVQTQGPLSLRLASAVTFLYGP